MAKLLTATEFKTNERRHGNYAVQFSQAAADDQIFELLDTYYGHSAYSPQSVMEEFGIECTPPKAQGGEFLAGVNVLEVVTERGRRETSCAGVGGDSVSQAAYRMACRILLQNEINEARRNAR